jgi:hypothetical protein
LWKSWLTPWKRCEGYTPAEEVRGTHQATPHQWLLTQPWQSGPSAQALPGLFVRPTDPCPLCIPWVGWRCSLVAPMAGPAASPLPHSCGTCQQPQGWTSMSLRPQRRREDRRGVCSQATSGKDRGVCHPQISALEQHWGRGLCPVTACNSYSSPENQVLVDEETESGLGSGQGPGSHLHLGL